MSTISASTTSTTAYKVTADTTGNLVLQTGSGPTTAVTIDTSQNMGLGVTPSAWATVTALQVKNAAFAGFSNSSYVASNAYYNGGWKYIASAAAARYEQGGGAHEFHVAGSGTAGNAITFTQAMTLDASGNLGVGTTSPSSQIHINGNSNSLFTAGLRVNRYQTTGQYGTINYSNGTFNIVATDAALTSPSISFSTSTDGSTPTERARIDSSGNLLVGTTSASNRLYVKATATGTVANYIEHTGASPYGLQIYYSGAAPNNSSNEFIYCSDTSNNRFIVYANGNVVNRNNSYGAISDIKLKENITDATPKLAQLSQVRVVNYNLIGDEKKQIGVIAQELEQIFPGMVEESIDKDLEGNELSTTTKQVKYSVFVPMLIKAIQEQQAIIETLTNRITALEAK